MGMIVLGGVFSSSCIFGVGTVDTTACGTAVPRSCFLRASISYVPLFLGLKQGEMPTDDEKTAGTGATISAATSENIFVNVKVDPSAIMKRGGIRDHHYAAVHYAQQQQKPQEEQERQQEQQQQAQLKSNRHPIVDFAIAGVSTSCACVLSNPVSLNAQRHVCHRCITALIPGRSDETRLLMYICAMTVAGTHAPGRGETGLGRYHGKNIELLSWVLGMNAMPSVGKLTAHMLQGRAGEGVDTSMARSRGL